MNICIRVDASEVIGTGHVMRCLVLANALRDGGEHVWFICREHTGHLCDLIADRGFGVARLPKPSRAVESRTTESWLGAAWEDDVDQTLRVIDGARPDWLVVDHYGVDLAWETACRPAVGRTMVVDDLANRSHACDLLLDQNYFPDAEERYSGYLPPYCARFFGPQYFLLGEDFRRAKRWNTATRQSMVLLFFGGSDPCRQTETAVQAVHAFDPSLPVTVVVGKSNPRLAAIREICQSFARTRVIEHTDRIADLMAGATVALAAGGTATYERIFMRLPSIVVAAAQNQLEPLRALAGIGCIHYLGFATDVGDKDWIAALRLWRTSGLAATALPVGDRTNKVIDAMRVELRPFDEEHVHSTYVMIQDANLRAAFAMDKAPEWHEHVRYWRAKRGSGDERVFAIHRGGQHIGNCGIKPVLQSDDYEIWVYVDEVAGRRSGCGEMAVRYLLRLAFVDMGLSRIRAHVKCDNVASLELFRKVGFLPSTSGVDSGVWGERAAGLCQLAVSR